MTLVNREWMERMLTARDEGSEVTEEDTMMAMFRGIQVMLPEPVQKALGCAWGSNMTKAWRERVASAVIRITVPFPPNYFGNLGATCPLCGSEGSGSWSGVRGFAFPAGLRMHLVGHGHMHTCEVMVALSTFASYYNRGRRAKERQAERDAEFQADLDEAIKEKARRVADGGSL